MSKINTLRIVAIVYFALVFLLYVIGAYVPSAVFIGVLLAYVPVNCYSIYREGKKKGGE